MDNYNTSINIRAGAHMNNNENSVKLPKQYTLQKDLYNDFVKQADKSDFKNAATRYMTEFRYLQNLTKAAERFGLQDELIELNKKMEDVKAKMKKRGVTLN